ncbi:MAG: LamG domain-containing protein [Sedimentisphaerales bacterium]|nr:LamG domain-containing protein [Sedimentisphaerales bacterium]
MTKRSIVPLVVVLALGLIVVPADAGLVGRWKCDEGAGATAYDSSGNGNNGTIHGAEWSDGKYGKALHFNGADNYVEVPTADSLEMDDKVTVSAWINWTDAGDGWLCVLANGQQNGPWENYGLFVNRTSRFVYLTLSMEGEHVTQQTPNDVVEPDEWVHVAATWDGFAARIYVNGVMELELPRTGQLVPTGLPLRIGHRNGSSHYFNGSIDDVQIYDQALTEQELGTVQQGDTVKFPLAYAPEPGNGDMIEATTQMLQWKPGDHAVSHDVYFGESLEGVSQATPADGAFLGNRSETSASVQELTSGATYYWRVDEVDEDHPDSPWKGEVWSFRVRPSIAWAPYPDDGVLYVLPDADLTWEGGMGSLFHTVYFGESFQEVDEAASGGYMTASPTYDPGVLEVDKTYYWRVDEFAMTGTTQKGEVWSFTTVPVVAPVEESNLVGWWSFDEGMGTTAVDWSGHGSHGMIGGNAQWVAGYHANALDMTGGASVDIPAESWSTIDTQATLALWLYGNPAGVPNNFTFGAFQSPTVGQTRVFSAHIPWSGRVYFDTGGSAAETYDRIDQAVLPGEYQGQWRHWAFVKNAETGAQEIYLDGELWHSAAGMTRVMTGITAFTLGDQPAGGSPYSGMMDDVRLYDRALTAEEIQQIMRGNPLLAWSPEPSRDAMVDIRDATSLNWSAGDTAASHDVYFGTDKAALELQGNQPGTSFPLAGLVEFGGGDYFWRIDEIEADATVQTGNVWSFTVPPYLIVDDFEGYSNEVGSRVFEVWVDGVGFTQPVDTPGNGTGALVGHDVWSGAYPTLTETGDVHGGNQAMPIYYDNTAAPERSEADRTFTPSQNWTVEGVATLVVHFRGEADNTGALYVEINDARVPYDGDPADIASRPWIAWEIDLASVGVNLTNVTTLTIGIEGGQTGVLYVDDMRLIRP